MLIQVKGKNLEVTDALKSYVDKKLRKLEKYFHDIREAAVTMSVSRGMHVVEVQLEGDGILLRGEERRGTDMYGSIDQVVEKLESRVKKFKGKRQGKTTEEGPKEKEAIKGQARDEAFGPEAAEAESEFGEMPAIVRTAKPMPSLKATRCPVSTV